MATSLASFLCVNVSACMWASMGPILPPTPARLRAPWDAAEACSFAYYHPRFCKKGNCSSLRPYVFAFLEPPEGNFNDRLSPLQSKASALVVSCVFLGSFIIYFCTIYSHMMRTRGHIDHINKINCQKHVPVQLFKVILLQQSAMIIQLWRSASGNYCI